MAYFDQLMETLPKRFVKICIPLQYNNKSDSFSIAPKFNSAGNYCILNLETKEYKLMEESELMTHFSERQKIGNEPKCEDIIISPSIPPMSHKILNDKGILVYIPKSTEILENLELFILQQLPLHDGKSYPNSNLCSSLACKSCPSGCN